LIILVYYDLSDYALDIDDVIRLFFMLDL